MMNNALTRGLTFAALVFGAFAGFGCAQAIRNDDRVKAAGLPDAGNDPFNLEKGTNEFGVWMGGSFNSPTLIGTATESITAMHLN